MGLEPTNLLTASQALYQLSYAPEMAKTLSVRVGPSARVIRRCGAVNGRARCAP
jgi:hypothetical protein